MKQISYTYLVIGDFYSFKMPVSKDVTKQPLRYLLLACGWLSFILGVIGVVLPLLPTTPFMLLAAACFSRSSERFHRWLLNNRVFGKIIRDWESERAMDKTIKVRVLVVVALTFWVSIAVVPFAWTRWLLIGLWLICTLCIVRIPIKADKSRVAGNH